MSKAKKLTVEELKALPWGGVAWCETYGEYDCGDSGIIKYYDVFPVMKTLPEQNNKGYVLVAGARYTDDAEIDNLPKGYVYWDKQPDPEQMEPDLVSWEQAVKIFNEYEKKVI